MTGKAGLPGSDPYRKARFRELAREIVFKDRKDRRSGYAVDTAGSIARALERAFREGFAAAQTHAAIPEITPLDEKAPVDWALIPPRPRDAFWSICLFCLGRPEHPKMGARLIPAVTERGTPGWLLKTDNDRDIKAIGAKSIAPLVRLGLLDPAGEPSPCLTISERGRATWDLFLERAGRFPEDLTLSDTIRRG